MVSCGSAEDRKFVAFHPTHELAQGNCPIRLLPVGATTTNTSVTSGATQRLLLLLGVRILIVMMVVSNRADHCRLLTKRKCMIQRD